MAQDTCSIYIRVNTSYGVGASFDRTLDLSTAVLHAISSPARDIHSRATQLTESHESTLVLLSAVRAVSTSVGSIPDGILASLTRSWRHSVFVATD